MKKKILQIYVNLHHLISRFKFNKLKKINTQPTYYKTNRGGLCYLKSQLANQTNSKTGKEINKIKLTGIHIHAKIDSIYIEQEPIRGHKT